MPRPLLHCLAATLALATTACADSAVQPGEGAVQPLAARHFSCAVRARKRDDALASPRWNQLARDYVTKYRTDPSARPYALLSLAQFTAVASAEDRSQGRCPSSRAAVAAASAGVLTYLYPGEAGAVAAALAEQLGVDAAAADAELVSAGETVGREAAELVIAYGRADGSGVPWTGTVPVGPGLWFSSATPPAPPATPILAQTRTYFLTASDQLRPAAPPAFGSPAFLAALDEVRSVTAARTPAQLDMAKKWSLSGGTHRIQGHWNVVATGLVEQYGLREREATHLLALMNMAIHDANVAVWDAKFTYWYIRPSQADRTIIPGISLSNHPSYPSSHAGTAGAAATVLGARFAAEAPALEAMASEIALSRLYGGVHYRFDNDTGLAMGAAAARVALAAPTASWPVSGGRIASSTR